MATRSNQKSAKARPTQREMLRAFSRRDASYDGIFFTAVRTTSIFCRPSCPAKKPLAKNIEFFATAKDALFAGYRPCKRCRPMDTNGRPPEWVRKLFLRVESQPDERIRDQDLRGMSIDPARARRYFQENYGMTFQAYDRARRLGRAFAAIREGGDLTDVAIGSGFDSPSGFRDAYVRAFGKPPGRSRMSTKNCIVTAMIESPVGPLLAGATDSAVCLLEFSDRRMLEAQMTTLRKRFARPIVPGKNRLLTTLRSELDRYFEGTLKKFSVPLEYPGTAFQCKVWGELLKIPYGETISYETLARRVGSTGAQRAVGTANGANRIAIIIPCHRVVNKDGKLGGYGGGLWRKQHLLELEKAAVVGREPLLFESAMAKA